jgi:predicted CoA-binding protein
MNPALPLDDQIKQVLIETRRIALVGASNKPDRPSFDVMQTLLSHGYQVTPVNPGLAGQTIQGQPVVATLEQAMPLDMVDVFRASDHVAAVMDDAIRLGAKTVWLQLGVADQAAAEAGREAGLTVIEDRCPKIELQRLGLRAVRADAV